MSSEYKAGKLLAYELLCRMTLRRHDVDLSMDHLLRFYVILHHGLASDDQVSQSINQSVGICITSVSCLGGAVVRHRTRD